MSSNLNSGIDVLEIRDRILTEGEKIMSLFQNTSVKAAIAKNCLSLYEKALLNYNKLKDFEYTIGMAAGQSAGKSSLINTTVLDYPVLPFCMGSTTCVPTILKYGEMPSIEISVKTVKQSNEISNEKIIIEEKRKLKLSCTSITETLYNKLITYLTKCHSVLGLKNVWYFTKAPILSYTSELNAEDLLISYNNPKHIAMMMITVLCAYVNQNTDEKLLEGKQLEALRMQQELLQIFGLNEDEKYYTVTLYWDAPLLKKGLVFYDLPGLDSNNTNNNGYLSHEQITKLAINDVQTAVYVFKPEVTKEGEDIIADFMNTESIRELNSKNERIIIAVNKIDRAGDSASVERALADAKASISKYSINPKIYGISAQTYSDYSFYKKGIINLKNTSVVNEDLKLKSLDQVEMLASFIEQKIDENNSTYPATDFLNTLNILPEKAIIMNASAFVRSLYKLLLELTRTAEHRIRIIGILHSTIDKATMAIIETLNKIALDASSEVQEIIKKCVNESLDEVKQEINFSQAFNEFMAKMDKEMDSLKETCKKTKDKLSENIVGDVVIARKNGIQLEQPNYDNWITLKSQVRNAKFNQSFTYITGIFKNLIQTIQDKCFITDINSKKHYEDILSLLLVQLNEKISEETEKLDALKKTIEETDNIDIIKTIILTVGDQLKAYICECLSDIEEKLKDTDDIDELNSSLVDNAIKQQTLIESEIRDLMKKKTEKLQTRGIIKTSTSLVMMSDINEFFENSFNIPSDWKEKLKSKLNPEDLITEYISKAKKSKKQALILPAMALNDKVELLKETFLKNNSDSIKDFRAEIELLTEMLKEISNVLCYGSSIDSSLDKVRTVSDFSSEIKNMEKCDFNGLNEEINEFLEKQKEDDLNGCQRSI